MRVRIPRLTDHRRPAPTRRGHVVQRVAPAPEFVVEPTDPEDRVREAGGPQDSAHYSCLCGFAFEARVSTSVDCPHCGTGQAW